MWRVDFMYFFGRSWEARWIYRPAATLLWIGALAGTAYNYLTYGNVRPWSVPPVAVGFMMMLVARSRIKQLGKRVGFGEELARELPSRDAFTYFAGYILMICGFVLSFGEPICLLRIGDGLCF